MSTGDRLERICERGLDDRALRIELLAEIRSAVPFDFFAWLLTDPETSVGVAPLADTPSLEDLPALIRLKYLTPTNRWTSLPTSSAVTLLDATEGDPTRSRVWSELLAAYGIDDVASTVFRDQFGCWGFLDLWRRGGSFTARECLLLTDVARTVTPALRRSMAATFAVGSGASDSPGEPAVLLLSEDLRPLTQTPRTDAYLRSLLPTDADQVPVPAGAFNVAAQLLAQEQGVDSNPASARTHLHGGLWVTLRAARMVGAAAGPEPIAVSIEPTPPTERTALFARVIGLTDKETELVTHLVAGADTSELARRLFVSPHTVQDHLKSVFSKAGTRSRRVLTARATGAG
ncbi:MAG: helix-turn-helix transcriptional regulator [Microthrixaceae bacterium]